MTEPIVAPPGGDRYRVVTDGTPVGTKVFGPNGDEMLHGVQAVHVKFDDDGKATRIELAVYSKHCDIEYAGDALGYLDDPAVRAWWLSIHGGLHVQHGSAEQPLFTEEEITPDPPSVGDDAS